jgi:hypothetical protein
MTRALLLALALSAPAAAQPGPAVLDVAAETDSVTVGEPFLAGVLLRAPAGSALDLVLVGPEPRAYEMVEPAREHPEGPGTRRLVATLVVWRVDPPGSAPAVARVTLPDGTEHLLPLELPLPPVRAVLPAEADQPRDARDIVAGPTSTPFPWEWLGAAGVLLLLLLAAWAAARRRRDAALAVDGRTGTLDALDALRREGLVEAGAVEAFYARLSRIVRDHAAPGVGTDLATQEAVERLRDAGTPPERVERLAELMRRADLAKFARRPPSAPEALADWTAAREWAAEPPGAGEGA